MDRIPRHMAVGIKILPYLDGREKLLYHLQGECGHIQRETEE